MKTSFVSTLGVSTATRLSLVKSQAELARASHELSSGRHADVGLTLGARTGTSVELRQELARIGTIIDTNGLVGARLDTMQAALSNVQGTAEDLLGVLIAVKEGSEAAEVVAPQAALNLKSLVGTMNANLNGQYLFAGINTDVPPMEEYFGPPPSAAKTEIDARFVTAFGHLPDDPLAATITPAAMAAFIDTQIAPLFADPGWGTYWSSASNENLSSRISGTETIETSANANEQPFRDLTMAYMMLSALGGETLSQGAYREIVDRAIGLVGGAMQDVTTVQARLGVAQNRVGDASDRMAIQRDILTRQVTDLENVDPFEAATRVNALMSQVEVSYSLTARIREMSLLRYL
ncbi:flagellar hook-associated family protein [Salinarimonas ramus]|uniref:Flagellin n=1 Tax=Salinarimonas ramus TaxID=690164 RepID=A0A917Q7D4_9HYPH|nr:flagellar hook-associated family protein [Salinarimonas ramus]GGK33138.1 flagellin [Salinarimonas ramus]